MTSLLRSCRPLRVTLNALPQAPLTIATIVLLLSFPTLAAQQAAGAAGTRLPLAAAAEKPSSPASTQGPVLASAEIATSALLLHFTNTGGGLRLEGRGRSAFQIAGADHVWYPADAHLVNGLILVSTSLVQQPVVVRYAPRNSREAVLFNAAGVAAAPFQTDRTSEIKRP